MTLEQIEHVLRELGWRGKPGTGPKVHINHRACWGEMWIEKGLVVFKGVTFFDHPPSREWMDPSEVTAIAPTSWSEHPVPLRVVEIGSDDA